MTKYLKLIFYFLVFLFFVPNVDAYYCPKGYNRHTGHYGYYKRGMHDNWYSNRRYTPERYHRYGKSLNHRSYYKWSEKKQKQSTKYGDGVYYAGAKDD